MQAVDRLNHTGLQNDTAAETLHAQHCNLLFHSLRDDQLGKLRKCASIMLSGIWTVSKWKRCCWATSIIIKVDVRIFVACEADEPDLPRLFGCQYGFH